MTARHAPVVISSCDTPAERRDAVSRLLDIGDAPEPSPAINLDGAERAVDEILATVAERQVR